MYADCMLQWEGAASAKHEAHEACSRPDSQALTSVKVREKGEK